MLGRRIRFVRTPAGPGAGPASARNFGVKESCGRFLYFLDDDDLFLPGRFQASLQFLRAGQYEAVLERTLRVDSSEKMEAFETGPAAVINCSTFEYLLLGGGESHITPGATSMTRVAFEKAGGLDESLRYGEDGEFLLRLCLHSNVALHHGECISISRFHIDNSSRVDRLSIWQNVKSLGTLYRKIRRNRFPSEKAFIREQLRGKLDFALSRYRKESVGLIARYGGGLRAIWHYPLGCWTVQNFKSVLVWLLTPKGR